MSFRRSKLINTDTKPDMPDNTNTSHHAPNSNGVNVETVIAETAVCAIVRIERVNAPSSPNQNNLVNTKTPHKKIIQFRMSAETAQRAAHRRGNEGL